MVPEKKGGLITHSISNVTAGSLPVDTLRERDANNFHPKDTFFFFVIVTNHMKRGHWAQLFVPPTSSVAAFGAKLSGAMHGAPN